MNTVTILILFMVIIIVYVALISVFSTLFRITGLQRSKALFQTISLLTGVGFTTVESEIITANKARRRLAIACMFIGHLLSLVILSLVVDTIAVFNLTHLQDSWPILLISFGVFAGILIFFNIPFVKKPLNHLIERIGSVLYFKKNKANVLTLMDKYDKDSIYQIKINILPEVLQNKTLFQSRIKEDYGINIMLVRRNHRSVVIKKDTMIQKGDSIIVFGNAESIESVFNEKHLAIQEKQLKEAKQRNIISIIENYKDKVMAEISIHQVPEVLKDTTLYKSSIKGQYGINIMLIKRDGLIIDIDQDTMINPYDTVILFGPYKNVEYLFSSEFAETK